jgi:hypothetical protein
MNSITIIVCFLCLMAFSLIVVSFANGVQTRGRLIHQKKFQLKRRIDELEEICTAIEPLLESVLIPKLINEEVLDLIRSLEQLDPNEPVIDIKRGNALEVADNLSSGVRLQPLYRVQPSDAAIARNKYCLTEASRVVRRHQLIGRLDTTELEAYIDELAWAHLMVEVVSLVSQGHKAVNRNEPMIAYGFYRKAQNSLLAANVRDDRRHRFIKEISEIFSGKRLSISTDLMPESEFNPKTKPSFDGVNLDMSMLNQTRTGV